MDAGGEGGVHRRKREKRGGEGPSYFSTLGHGRRIRGYYVLLLLLLLLLLLSMLLLLLLLLL